MYMLISSKPPFDGESETQILDKIKAGEFDFDTNISEEAKFLISHLLTPAKIRLNPLEALQD